MQMPPLDLTASLRRAGLIHHQNPAITPLTGGVSSEILRVQDGDRSFVVKRALAKLKVRDDWFADVSRNQVEENYLRRVGEIAPGSVPQVLHAQPDEGWFAMEFLGSGFVNWKSELLANRADPSHAQQAGNILGRIHGATWGDPEVAQEFATLENFRQLRLEPYLETTAERVSDLAPLLRAEKERLSQTALCLVHGDFSPKNILISPERMVVVDAEVGWFGDPVFDTAFLLTHFHLKALLHTDDSAPVLSLVPTFWQAYSTGLGSQADADLEARTVRLVLCLLLARVHGKSPVEYLTLPSQRNFLTTFVRQHLPRPFSTLSLLTAAWQEGINRL